MKKYHTEIEKKQIEEFENKKREFNKKRIKLGKPILKEPKNLFEEMTTRYNGGASEKKIYERMATTIIYSFLFTMMIIFNLTNIKEVIKENAKE